MLEHGLLENKELEVALTKRNIAKTKRIKAEVGPANSPAIPTLPNPAVRADRSPSPESTPRPRKRLKSKLKIKKRDLFNALS